MCLIVFAYDCHPDYRLILGANRDEFRNRPADPAGFWKSAPYLLAGRDKQAGGTWMGVTTTGKFAAITNYRDPRIQVTDPPSRGRLVADFLLDASLTPEAYQALLSRDGQQYDGFNLLYGNLDALHYFTNRGGSSGPIAPGIHGLSNHLLDTSWAKVTMARSRLEAILQQGPVDPEEIFAALSDPVPFADNLLPDTGVGLDRERMLSPLFIENEEYGTRSSTVILISRNGQVSFLERIIDSSSGAPSSQNLRFQFQSDMP
jgi:uncharacterized protein with NRDE domain